MPDYYEILGVKKSASADEVRKAFKKLARKYHPDFNPGNKDAERRFKEVNEAHAVLSSPEKRKLYDEFGEPGLREGFDPKRAREWSEWGKHGGFARERAGAPFGSESPFGGFEFHFGGPGGEAAGGASTFEDLFSALRGGAKTEGPRARRARRGADIESDLEIGFAQAIRGGTESLLIKREGTEQKVEVKIPAGIRDGAKIRLPDLGQAGAGGAKPGDLYIRVHVTPHRFFERRGEDIVLELPVTIGEAVAGATVRIPTPHGAEVDLRIPPGTSSGQTLRLRGLGVRGRTGETGDLLVRVAVKTPRNPDRHAMELARRLDDFYDENPRRDLAP